MVPLQKRCCPESCHPIKPRSCPARAKEIAKQLARFLGMTKVLIDFRPPVTGGLIEKTRIGREGPRGGGTPEVRLCLKLGVLPPPGDFHARSPDPAH